jgi:Domain of unknown function (DUF4159)
VNPDTMSLYDFPILYISGQRDFAFSKTAREKLRNYLDHGGTLIADDVVGASGFDQAFRREMKLIDPGQPLEPLPDSSPIFDYVFDERTARLAPLARQLLGPAIAPRLDAIRIDGRLAVIYSPLSLSAGWEELPQPYDKGYADSDALKLGVNLFMYVASH